jgi:hypothetical protein
MNSAAAESFWAFEAIGLQVNQRISLPVGAAWMGAHKVLQLGIFLAGTAPGPNKFSWSGESKESGASRQGKQHQQRWRTSTAWNSSLAKIWPATGT